MTLSDGNISVCVGWKGLWELVKMQVGLTLVGLPRASFVLLGTCPFLTEIVKLSASDQGQVSLGRLDPQRLFGKFYWDRNGSFSESLVVLVQVIHSERRWTGIPAVWLPSEGEVLHLFRGPCLLLVVFCFSAVIDRGISRAVVASIKSPLFVLTFTISRFLTIGPPWI